MFTLEREQENKKIQIQRCTHKKKRSGVAERGGGQINRKDRDDG